MLQTQATEQKEKQRSYPELIERYMEIADDIGADMDSIGSFTCSLGTYALYVMHLTCGTGRQRIVISTGMHGDEPAGPEALIRGLKIIGQHRDSLDAEFIIFPCDNPTGWELNTRENFQGLDLNREFSKKYQAQEIAIVEGHLRSRTLDFTLDLHEDIDTSGMYLYERSRNGSNHLGEEMVRRLKDRGYPVHEADWIEGMKASGGIIRPTGAMRNNNLPKAVYIWHTGCPHLITTESPGKLELDQRVDMQLVCFDLFLEAVEQGRFVNTH